MRLLNYAGSGAVVAVLILLAFPSPIFAQNQKGSAPSLLPPIPPKDLPTDIQQLIKKSPATRTEEENKKMTAFMLSMASNRFVTSSSTPQDTVNCFDYYHFGSVLVDLVPALPQTVPGVAMTFSGEVRNTNSYPIVDGQVYVKIFRQQSSGQKPDMENGPDLVDQFPLKDNFNIPAHGSKKTSFSWKVPENAPAGQYAAAFFFETAKRYNLLGLSFTDDVTGNQAPFTVTSKDKGGIVMFNKKSVLLNGQQYRFASFPSNFDKVQPVTIFANLINERNASTTVSVTWKLYSWDGLREEALRDTQEQKVHLDAKQIKSISYIAQPINSTVSYLVAEADDGASKSILDIRFVRDGIDETRINFPSITDYPLEAGKENTLFSCAHSTSAPVVTDNTLTLTLRDDVDNVIHTYTYSGDITSNMMGMKDLFTPKKTYATFSLTATLKHKGDVVEEVREVYDCKRIDPTLCPVIPPSSNPFADMDVIPLLAGGAAILVLLAFLGWKTMRIRVKRGGPLEVAVFLLVISGGIFFSAPLRADAASSSLQYSISSIGGGGMIAWPDPNPRAIGIITSNTTVTRDGILVIFDPNTAQYSINFTQDGQTIPSNGKFQLVFDSGSWYGISWNGTGGVWDSPYGRWSSTPRNCAASWNTCAMLNQTPYEYWTADLAILPVEAVPVVSGATCIRSNLSTLYSCTVTAAEGQTVSINAAWPPTHGIFSGAYFSYYGAVPLTSFNIGVPSATLPSPWLLTVGPAIDMNTAPHFGSLSDVTGIVNQSIPFSVNANDDESDPIRYGIDWNSDGSVDQWLPSSGYVPSGTTQSYTKTWATAGTYSFKVLAQDSHGKSSVWNTQNVTVNDALNVTFTAVPAAIYQGDSTVLSWNASNVDYCNVPIMNSFSPDGGVHIRYSMNSSYVPASGGTVTGTLTVPTYQFPATSPFLYSALSAGDNIISMSCNKGSVKQNMNVTVTILPSATSQLNGPPAIVQGNPATLTWDSSGTSVCTGVGFDTGGATSNPTIGVTVYPAAPSTTYTLNCDHGAPPQSLKVMVSPPPPVVHVIATPTTVYPGGAVRLTWNSVSIASCTGVGFNTGGAVTNSTGVIVNPLVTTDYTINCIPIWPPSPPAPPPPTISDTAHVVASFAAPVSVVLTATPQNVNQGQSTMLTWTSVGAGTVHCDGTNFSTGGSRPASNAVGVMSLPMAADTIFTVTCCSGANPCLSTTPGSGSDSRQVLVNKVPAVNFWAEPDTIDSGGSALLKWTSNADHCGSGGGFDTLGAASNSTGVSVGPLAVTTPFLITCVNSVGTTQKTATVNVNVVVPVLSITATPTRVKKGGTVSIAWSSNVSGCTVSGPGVSSALSTSSASPAITTQSTYTITCGATTKSVTANVVPGYNEF